ncbi:MAG: phosphatase PAP2 family protein [Eubacteriales bacterium]|nr:phosphatase PAP2 family protein [Eubacteriales bacterium]NLF47013.1 phosphatase PAP2 family protein [Clostridiales bacterium]
MTKKIKTLQVAILSGAVVCFALITYIVITGMSSGFDNAVMEFFYGIRKPGLDTLMELITYMANWETIVIICLLLICFPQTRRKAGISVSIAALLSTLVKAVIKTAVARPRPEESFFLIEQSGFAYPSGHAMTGMAVYLLLFVLTREYITDSRKKNLLSVIFVFVAFAVGISRVYLGVHFPTDVIGGWVLGAATVIVSLMIWENLKKRSPYCSDLS